MRYLAVPGKIHKGTASREVASDATNVRACGPLVHHVQSSNSSMKFPVLLTLCLAAFSTPVLLAQQPAPGAPPPAGAADKSKALSASDKSALKKMLETIFFETNLTDQHKNNNAKTEATKKLAEKMNTDLNKIWGELAALVEPTELPTELAGGDKSKSQRISKAGDKYDKELLEVLEKESKQLERSFESASKATTMN